MRARPLTTAFLLFFASLAIRLSSRAATPSLGFIISNALLSRAHTDICDAADAMEAALLQHAEFKDKKDEIKQGVDRWQLRVQRAADQQLDQFDAAARTSVFTVPADVQFEAPTSASAAAAEAAGLDSETAALWARLQQALATKRELKRKLTAAENVSALWAAHRASVQQLAASQEANGAAAALDGADQLSGALANGWQLLNKSGAAAGQENPAASAASEAAGPGPRGLQQRFTQRRAEINTVSVPDLGLLSSLLAV